MYEEPIDIDPINDIVAKLEGSTAWPIFLDLWAKIVLESEYKNSKRSEFVDNNHLYTKGAVDRRLIQGVEDLKNIRKLPKKILEIQKAQKAQEESSKK